LVAVDSDRREGRGPWFVLWAVLAAAVVGGVAWWTGGQGLSCLLLVDLVWNAWHFGSQHAGILRIYSGKTGGGRRGLETYALRILVIYVILQLVGWLTEWTAALGTWQSVWWMIDVCAVAPALVLLGLELTDRPWQRWGKVAYLASVTGIYLSLLIALRGHWRSWLLPLTTCSAAFHAVEYLSVITYYAKRRTSHGSLNLFQKLARNWFVVFVAYLVLFGMFSLSMTRRLGDVWLAVNLWAAYLHYLYDGMIWKLRRTGTARTLGTQGASRGAGEGVSSAAGG
jgi:hypothetical protein